MIVIEHDLKVETTKINQQHGIRFFREAHPPGLNFARQSQVWMDVIQCCMMIGWAYLESSSFILFASNLKWLVTEIPEGLCLELYFYAHFIRALRKKSKSSCYLPKMLVLGRHFNLSTMLNLKAFGSTINTPKLSSILNLKDI